MPNPFIKGHSYKSQVVDINRGPYAMAMSDGENAEITMYGEIVRSRPVHLWTGEPIEGDFIVQDEFLSDLDRLAKAITITIRMDSVGGDSIVGMVIHNRLREFSANGTRTVCIVDGAAMSAASMIMCGCDEVRINPASLVMVHRCWSRLWGGYNADDLRELTSMHEAYDRAAVTTYQRKTGLDEDELLRMMSETTYLTGAEAVEKGFADKLLEDAKPLNIAASADGRSLFVRGKVFHLTPGMFAPDTIPTLQVPVLEAGLPVSSIQTQPEQSGTENGGIIMAKNLEELRKADPALAEMLMAEAKAEVSSMSASAEAEAERQRIMEIDALAGVFDTETINAAKYGEHMCTAQEMVYQAAQKAAQQGKAFLAAMETDMDSSGAQSIGAANGMDDVTAAVDTPQKLAAQAKADAKAFNERKKEVR